MPKSWKKPAVLVLSCAGLLATWHVFSSRSAGASELKFTTVPVTRGSLTARVTAVGTLSARVTVQVGSQVSGRIAALSADFNSTVKKGQVIARLDPALFEAAVEQAAANLAAAEGGLARAKIQARDAERQGRRAADLFEQKLLSQADRDSALANAEAYQAGVVVAEGALAQTRAALNEARINLAYTVIASPVNGVVISRSVDVGQTVAATLQAPVLFTIAEDLTQMQVHTSVAESDIGKLREGMAVAFTVDAYPGESFRGELTQIRSSPQLAQNVVTYDAVLDAGNTGLRLKPGMTANVSFIYASREDVLLVPNAALRFRPPPELQKAAMPVPELVAGQRLLFVSRPGQFAAVPVQIGLSDGTRTEILDGSLREGDEVVAGVTSPASRTSQQPTRVF